MILIINDIFGTDNSWLFIQTYHFAKLLESLLPLNFSDFGEIFSKAPTLYYRKRTTLWSRIIVPLFILWFPTALCFPDKVSIFLFIAMTAMTHWSWQRVAHCCRNVQPRNRACRYPMIRRRLRLANSSLSSWLQMRITSRSEFTRRIIRSQGRRPSWILRQD